MYNKEKVQNVSEDQISSTNKTQPINKRPFTEISPTATISAIGEVAQGALGALTFEELMGYDIFGDEE